MMPGTMFKPELFRPEVDYPVIPYDHLLRMAAERNLDQIGDTTTAPNGSETGAVIQSQACHRAGKAGARRYTGCSSYTTLLKSGSPKRPKPIEKKGNLLCQHH